jgi:transposase-like protein
MTLCHCSRCHSANTIRVEAELLREHWYCYDCGRSFEVPIEDTGYRTGVRPRLRSTSTVSARLNGRTVDIRSLGVK